MRDTIAVLARLGTTFERTASVRDDDDLEAVLEDVARAISEVLSYRVVVINVYRAAFDDMRTATAVGAAESVHDLVGTISPRHTWTPLLAERFRRREGAYFVPDGEFDWDALGVDTYLPDLEPVDDPNAWLAGDALFVPLWDTRHQLLGIISVDEPETGLRPTDAELDVLVTIAQHAALALRIGQDMANEMQHQRMLERVLEVSAGLAEARDVDAVLQAVSDGIQDALGFEKVLIGIADESTRPLITRASSGWEPDAPALEHGASLDDLDGLLSEEFEVAGCYLLPGEVGEARLGVDDFPYRSVLNGRGPHAWSRHWLLVPLVEGDRRIGVIWVDDPRDRLLPTRGRLQALRLFANQAVAALHTAKQSAQLRHEATHDSLTGLPNRRAFRSRLEREISVGGGFALVLCDMDNLKTVNDTRGHDAGDKALQTLADALRAELRRSDEAYRVGGDEFAVLLPGASRLDAERVMRRLRETIPADAPSDADPIEASFGIALLEPGDDAERVITRADQALYQAKRKRAEVA
ncbi:MAG TPA: diguanylate cyclase [Thermoleophilaceae bacterium]|jgi:diguanylate cyclase (GGDEF)-like protein|nr:diguanylate cyclase [Thermoleophilaceae bacterium]